MRRGTESSNCWDLQLANPVTEEEPNLVVQIWLDRRDAFIPYVQNSKYMTECFSFQDHCSYQQLNVGCYAANSQPWLDSFVEGPNKTECLHNFVDGMTVGIRVVTSE